MKLWFGKTMTPAPPVSEVQILAIPPEVGDPVAISNEHPHPASFDDWRSAMILFDEQVGKNAVSTDAAER